VPGSGRIISNAADPRLAETLSMGAWTPVETFAAGTRAASAQWRTRAVPAGDFSRFEVLERDAVVGRVEWSLLGWHNLDNGLAAIAAARHAGVPVPIACEALGQFKGIKRRMELRGEVAGIRVYDDFAHHPTAIATTIDGLRRSCGERRIVAVLEPRSYTMKAGVHRHTLPGSFAGADECWIYAPPDIGWDAGPIAVELGPRAQTRSDLALLCADLARSVRPGDQVLIMSNGGFGGLHGKLLDALRSRFAD
jgi:UDP-N-acetylmuramate: L-alanyl-gamma-D-glutamyl-meso-diaminopimelate ligase